PRRLIANGDPSVEGEHELAAGVPGGYLAQGLHRLFEWILSLDDDAHPAGEDVIEECQEIRVDVGTVRQTVDHDIAFRLHPVSRYRDDSSSGPHQTHTGRRRIGLYCQSAVDATRTPGAHLI